MRRRIMDKSAQSRPRLLGTELRTPPDIHQETEEPQKIRSDLTENKYYSAGSGIACLVLNLIPERQQTTKDFRQLRKLVGEILDGLKHWKFAREPILDPRNAFDVVLPSLTHASPNATTSGLGRFGKSRHLPLLKASLLVDVAPTCPR